MKSLIYYLIALGLIFSSCSVTKKSIDANADGSTIDKAVVITENNEMAGIDAEYAWIKVHYPGYHTLKQVLISKNKKSYDVITIKTADDVQKDIYFDIDNFFGKH